MASITPVRITGVVVDVSNRKGTSQAGNVYDLDTVTVLVGGKGTAAFTGSRAEIPTFTEGELVDLLVEVQTYRNEANLRYLGAWDEARATALAEAFAA